MGLKIRGVPNIFSNSTEDGQVLKSFGIRRVPSEDDDTIVSLKKSDEYVVDAAGDGDYTTIAAALAELGASSGTIRVLAGNYTITSNISLGANQSIVGSGYGTNITTTSNITMITLTGNRSAIYMCRIDGNNTGSSQVGVVVTGDECVVKDCWITQMGDRGMTIGGNRCVVEGCRIEDCTDTCVYVSGDHLFMSDTIIDNSAENGMHLNGASDGSVVGCRIENHGEHGIECDSTAHFCISGCRIFSNGDNNNNGDGIEFGAGCHENVVTGCHIGNNDGNGITDGDGNNHRQCVVGNVVYNNEDNEIVQNGAGDGVFADNVTA